MDSDSRRIARIVKRNDRADSGFRQDNKSVENLAEDTGRGHKVVGIGFATQ